MNNFNSNFKITDEIVEKTKKFTIEDVKHDFDIMEKAFVEGKFRETTHEQL